MAIVQNITTGERCKVSKKFVDSSKIIRLMLQDTTADGEDNGEGADEVIPISLELKYITNLDLIIHRLNKINVVAMIVEGSMGIKRKINMLDFIENHYTLFLAYIENAEIMLKETIESLELIKEDIGIENIIDALYTTNFLDSPIIMRGVAFIIGHFIKQTSYDTKFRIFNNMRFRLGHLTSMYQTYKPTEPIEKGWDRFIELMKPNSLAVPLHVIEIINNVGSYKVHDVYLKELEKDIFNKFNTSSPFRKTKTKLIYGKCDGYTCFRCDYLDDNQSDGDNDDDDNEMGYSPEVMDIRKKLALEKQAMVENISFLETTNVSCLKDLFKDCDSFNLPLLWNVSNVVDFQCTFSGAKSFNQPLNWNTRNASNMSFMFNCASSFNQPLYWDTSNVIKMSGMFFRCKSFNSPTPFNTENLKYADSMFAEIPNFNQPVDFDMSKLMHCHSMFREAKQFNQPVNWDTPNLLRLENVFDGATNFNQKVPWNTKNVRLFSCVFRDAESFNQPIEWDFSKATMTNQMFRGAKLFNHPIKSMSPKLVSMDCMFSRAISFNSIVDLDTSNVSMMKELFRGATAFNQSLDSWNFNKAYCMSHMFLEAVSFSHKLPFDHTRVKFPCDLFN